MSPHTIQFTPKPKPARTLKMMLGERNYAIDSPWSFATNDNSTYPLSPNTTDDYSLLTLSLQHYLSSNNNVNENEAVSHDENLISVDAHSCDDFHMYEFKVRKCMHGNSHDWTECPFAHPGEKARRRDPRKFHYSGTACPDFRRGSCAKGDACEHAHGVFECWLHPARYRTQSCKDGMSCTRRICFFAHSPDQIRVISLRVGSPNRVGSPERVNEMVVALRQLQLSKSMPNSWVGGGLLPRVELTRPGLFSVPTTPTRIIGRPEIGYFENWDDVASEEEQVMERVESGRDLRAKMFEKLGKENPLDRVDPEPNTKYEVGLGWVSGLLN